MTATGASAHFDTLAAQRVPFRRGQRSFLRTVATGFGLDYANGLVADDNGDIYVASVGTNRVIKFDARTGQALLQFSGGGLTAPDGVRLHNGTLLIGSFSTNSVKQYNLDSGLWIRDLVAASSGGLNGPAGVIEAANGNMLVASQNDHRVLEFEGQTGAFVRVAAQGGGLAGPEGLLLDGANNLLVASFLGGQVLKYAPDGSFVGVLIPAGSGGLSSPSDLAWATNGDLLVANRSGNNVLEFTSTGAFVRVFGSGIPQPTHIAVGYFCDPDCNANGSLDRWDIAAGHSRDLNNDGIPDECQNCIGDLTGDQFVGLDDLTRLLSHFGQASGATYQNGDITGDGAVSLADLTAFLSVFGTVCQ